jgi:hypothetical protein
LHWCPGVLSFLLKYVVVSIALLHASFFFWNMFVSIALLHASFTAHTWQFTLLAVGRTWLSLLRHEQWKLQSCLCKSADWIHRVNRYLHMNVDIWFGIWWQTWPEGTFKRIIYMAH